MVPHHFHTKKFVSIGGAVVAVSLAAALWMIHPALLVLALLAATGVAGFVGWRWFQDQAHKPLKPTNTETAVKTTFRKHSTEQTSDDPCDLVDQMLRQGRYALLLRPQIMANLTPEQLQRALSELDEGMALVPDGDVVMKATRLEEGDEDDKNLVLERVVRVEPLFLDRYPVTNQQFKAFVAAGGYEQISLWDPSVWPAILDFVDSTGHSGPRFWKNGNYPSGEGDHPVVGISWYEACAYARWVGKRLATDPEWVKAGSWPVQVPGGKPVQRKYPWGETMDRALVNVWGSSPGKTVPVEAMNGGGSVGGVYQLIGNCWEWTSSNFGAWDPAPRRVETATPMKSLRGGAFDTYFDSQAHNQFQSATARWPASTMSASAAHWASATSARSKELLPATRATMTSTGFRQPMA